MSSVTLPQLISEAHDARLADVYTTIPGRIKTISAGVASVELMIKRPVRTVSGYRFEPFKVLPSVPVLQAQSSDGANAITIPVNAGDWVRVFFGMLDESAYRATGTVSNPELLDFHSLSVAFALPVGAPDAQLAASAAEPAVCVKGTEVRLGAAVDAASVDPVVTVSGLRLVLDSIFGAWTPASSPDAGAALKAVYTSLSGDPLWPMAHGSPSVKAEKP